MSNLSWEEEIRARAITAADCHWMAAHAAAHYITGTPVCADDAACPWRLREYRPPAPQCVPDGPVIPM